jgi:TnpA family transposase
MYARVREFLTPEERVRYMQIPDDISEWELGTYFTFSQHDIGVINRHRRGYNRLGFAVQLCVLRYTGWTLADIKDIPEALLRYIANQIKVDIEVFAYYAQREATRYEHLEEIRNEYGFSTFTAADYRKLSKYLYPHAMVNGNAIHLTYLRKKSPTSKREGAEAPVKVGDEFRLGVA